MILKFIVATLLVQVLLYLISDKIGFQYGKWVVLALCLIGHFFFFPDYFLDKFHPPRDEGRCGTPIVGIFGLFWIVGGILTFVTHFLYWVYSTAYKERKDP